MEMAQLFGFPNPVNEKAARVVAGVVALTSVLALATGWRWLLVPLAYGFIARVLTGPKLSPLGRFATKVAAPRLGEPKDVSGPPKRFAQSIGAVLTTAGAVFWVGFGWGGAADAILAVMAAFATLESVFAYCVGCKVFGLLMRAGVIPDEICAECADIWSRPGAPERPSSVAPSAAPPRGAGAGAGG
jgi:hypothetical protein